MKTILCICHNGNQSSAAAKVLNTRGYRAVACSVKAKAVVQVASQLADVVFVPPYPDGLVERVQGLIDKPVYVINMCRHNLAESIKQYEEAGGLPDSG